MASIFYRPAACLLTALVFTCGLARAAELNPAAVTYTLPDKVQWEGIPGFPGAQRAVWSAIPRSPDSTR
jgi:hypothetical protein